MNIEENQKKPGSEDNEALSLAIVAILGEVLLESLQTTDQKRLEVFECYTHVLRSKIHTHGNDFCTHLTKGYKVLIDELKKC